MTGRHFEAVVIGASAGAVEALSVLLPALPRGYPLAILIVIHLPPDKKSVMAEIMSAKCALPVKEAEDKESIAGGTIYFAPPDYHLLVEADKSLSLSSEEPVLFSRPSIDILFETAADAYGAELIGIILSGANEDGARGLKAVLDAGGAVVVQQPELAYASAMPLAALEACPDAIALSLEQIASYLQKVVHA